MAIFIVILSVASVVVSLTGPSEPQSLEPARSQENAFPIGQLLNADTKDADTNSQEAQRGQQTETQVDPVDEERATTDEETVTKRPIDRAPEELAISTSGFIPNYVGQGEEMKLSASFTPTQVSSYLPSQPVPAPSQPAPTSPPVTEPYEPEINETFIPNVERWRDDVVAAIAAYGGPASDVDLFLTIMHRESRGQPEATNPSSGAAGLMQHMPQYWDQRAISAGYAGASPYDPIANINVSAGLLYQAAGGGWVHWSTY